MGFEKLGESEPGLLNCILSRGVALGAFQLYLVS
jgi:hypothetical protein